MVPHGPQPHGLDEPTGGPLSELDVLFVYGTLMAGRVRWPLLEPYVLEGPTPASVTGRLFDTGLDFPAARFDREGTVHGELFRIEAEALPFLDEVEGSAHGLYRRVVVTTHDGTEAWAYEFGGETDAFVDLDGRWTGA